VKIFGDLGLILFEMRQFIVAFFFFLKVRVFVTREVDSCDSKEHSLSRNVTPRSLVDVWEMLLTYS
jgi:hypothetical protein